MLGRNSRVVVDACLVIKWLLSEEDSEVALALLDHWISSGTQRIAPYSVPFEVANAPHRRIVNGELTVDAGAELVENLLESHIQLRQTDGLHRRALEIATALGHGASYDSHYVALAEVLDCEFWTADERFHRATSPAFAGIRLLNDFAAPSM